MDAQTSVGKSSGLIGYKPIACVDRVGTVEAMPGWNFEFTQLSPGALVANGGMVALNCVLVGQLTLDQALLRRGHAPHGSAAVLIPGSASSQAFVRGRKLEPTQCIAIADGASIEVITHRNYVDVALAVDLHAWRGQSQWWANALWPRAAAAGSRGRGHSGSNRMRHTVRWLFTAIQEYPQAMGRPDVRASLADQFVVAMAHFGSERVDAERPTRDARVQQRIAVERAREYIRGKAGRAAAALRAVPLRARAGALARVRLPRDHRPVAHCVRQVAATERRPPGTCRAPTLPSTRFPRSPSTTGSGTSASSPPTTASSSARRRRRPDIGPGRCTRWPDCRSAAAVRNICDRAIF